MIFNWLFVSTPKVCMKNKFLFHKRYFLFSSGIARARGHSARMWIICGRERGSSCKGIQRGLSTTTSICVGPTLYVDVSTTYPNERKSMTGGMSNFQWGRIKLDLVRNSSSSLWLKQWSKYQPDKLFFFPHFVFFDDEFSKTNSYRAKYGVPQSYQNKSVLQRIQFDTVAP